VNHHPARRSLILVVMPHEENIRYSADFHDNAFRRFGMQLLA